MIFVFLWIFLGILGYAIYHWHQFRHCSVVEVNVSDIWRACFCAFAGGLFFIVVVFAIVCELLDEHRNRTLFVINKRKK